MPEHDQGRRQDPSIPTLVKDPNFLLCTSSASSGDAITIAVGGDDRVLDFRSCAFSDVASCMGRSPPRSRSHRWRYQAMKAGLTALVFGGGRR